MKYIKTYKVYEQGDQDMMAKILLEIEYRKEIEKFFDKHGLKKLDVPIKNLSEITGTKIKNDILTVYYGDFEDYTTVYQIYKGKKEELGVGTPRDQVYQIYEAVLDYIYKISPEDLEDFMTKKNMDKYNL